MTFCKCREASNTLDISDLHDVSFAYANRMVSYIDGDKYYLCVLNRQYVEVYENGKPYMEYDFNEIIDELKKDEISAPLLLNNNVIVLKYTVDEKNKKYG